MVRSLLGSLGGGFCLGGHQVWLRLVSDEWFGQTSVGVRLAGGGGGFDVMDLFERFGHSFWGAP